jgi:hypothetical protein
MGGQAITWADNTSMKWDNAKTELSPKPPARPHRIAAPYKTMRGPPRDQCSLVNS